MAEESYSPIFFHTEITKELCSNAVIRTTGKVIFRNHRLKPH